MVNEQELTDEELAERVQSILDSSLDEGDKIRQLRDLGYSNTQIHQEFGFKKSTVYRVCPVRPAKQGGSDKSIESKGKFELMKIGSKDMIPPEAVLDVLHLPQDGDSVQVWRSGVLDGVGLLLLGARYSQLCGAGQAEVVKSQLDIMREAKESSRDIAIEAAHQTALEMANFIEQRIPKGEPPKDLSQMFTKRIDRMWDMMEYMQTQRMFPGYQAGKPPEGWTRERSSSTPPSGPPAPPEQGEGTPPGFTRESEKGGEE